MTNLDMTTSNDVAAVAGIPGDMYRTQREAAALTARIHADIATRLTEIVATCPQLARTAQDGLNVVAATAPASRASAPKVASTNVATKKQDNHRRRPNGLGMNQ